MRADGSRRRPRALVPAAALLLTALTACSAGTTTPPAATAAATTPAPAETTTPSAGPTPDGSTPPERPAAMDSPTADGAAAAATYFLLLYPYIYATGDIAEWAAMSAPTCDFCIESQDDAEARVAEGEPGGAALVIERAEGIELSEREWYSARLRVTQNATATGEGGTYDFDFAMTWDDGWTIDSVGIEPAEE